MSEAPATVAMPNLSAAPDWSSIDWDVHCPLCSYNLRGLNLPRCPECGYRFAWREVLDRHRRKHPYLFEHHPERSFWSFRKTVLGALRPKRFWTSLHPVMPSNPNRLFSYWFVTAMLLVMAVVPLACFSDLASYLFQVAYGTFGGSTWSGRPWGMSAMPGRLPPSVGAYQALWDIVRELERELHRCQELLIGIACLLMAWPALTLFSLMIFRWSMQRAKVNAVHVARCVAYGFDLFPAAILGFLTAPLAAAGVAIGLGADWLEFWLLLSFVGATAFCFRRLRCAYSQYLRFDRPFLTILASQAVVTVAALTVLLPLLAASPLRFRSPWLRTLMDCVRGM